MTYIVRLPNGDEFHMADFQQEWSKHGSFVWVKNLDGLTRFCLYIRDWDVCLDYEYVEIQGHTYRVWSERT